MYIATVLKRKLHGEREECTVVSIDEDDWGSWNVILTKRVMIRFQSIFTNTQSRMLYLQLRLGLQNWRSLGEYHHSYSKLPQMTPLLLLGYSIGC